MDWFNTQFYRDYGYGLVYPQIFSHQKRPSDEAQASTIAWGKERAERWLQILNDHWLGPDAQYLCGNQVTIADYFGSALVSLGEIIRCNIGKYPNVERWLNNMKQLKSWPEVNEVFDGFAESLQDRPFTAI